MSNIQTIFMDTIVPNPFQPRYQFDQEGLNELAVSIRENGLIQPIVVRENNGCFEIVAGERRFRACQLLGWQTIQAIVTVADDQEMAQMALIENIQREDLSPVEEAKAYRNLLKMTNSTQEELAQQVGRSQSSVANKLRLLNLSPLVQQAIAEKAITERHGRAMLNLDEQQQQTVLEEIIKKNLTVKQTENFIKKLGEEEDDDEFSIRCFGVSTRIAVNTIMQAVKSLQQVNMPIEVKHQDNPEEYVMTITIKK